MAVHLTNDVMVERLDRSPANAGGYSRRESYL